MFNLNDPISLAINIVIIIFIVSETYSGYKKGFFESSIRFLGFILAVIGAYLIKDPLSVFLYSHLPFFKLDGLFKGVSALNIVIYEIIAFIIVFVVLILVVNIICRITRLIDRVISAIFILGIPNKVLGAIVGFIQSFVILYFAIFGIKVAGNLLGMEMRPSLADTIVNMPVLKETFGDVLESLDEITVLAKNYENTKDKEAFNNECLDILVENNVITKENLEILINSGKFGNVEEEKVE